MRISRSKLSGMLIRETGGPSYFEWSSGTYLDSWTSQTSASSDLATSGGPGLTSAGYSTNQLVWQLFFAHVSVELTVASNKWGYVSFQGGSNSVGLRGTISTEDNTLGSFAADTNISTILSDSYTAGELKEKSISTLFTVPANRYFMLGVVGGPFYRIFKSLYYPRVAQIGGSSVISVINKFYWGRWTDGPTTGIPTQLGGAATFTEVSNAVPMTSFKFTTV